ncbi:MAG: hypothetical protein Phog2KO_41270 [Phototrophicaceae bacterium]
MKILLRYLIISLLFMAVFKVNANSDYCDEASNNSDLAFQYLSESNFIRAITLYSCEIDSDSDNAEPYLYRGIAYFNFDYFDLALEDLDTSISLDNTSPEAYSTRAYIHQLMGNNHLAERDYLSAIDLWIPESLAVLQTLNLRYARTLVQLQNFDEAINIYNMLIEANPDYALAYLYRGIAYKNLQDNNQFQDNINLAISIDFTVVRQYLSEVYRYTEVNNFTVAHEIASNGISISPDDFQAYYEQGYVYFSEGLYEEAIQEFDTAIELNDNMLSAYQFRGLAYHYMGDTEFGLQSIDLALERLPTMYTAYFAKAVIYQDLGDTKLAISNYLESLSIFPNQLLTYLELGKLYFDNNDLESSLFYYNQYLVLAECIATSEAMEQVRIIESMLDE